MYIDAREGRALRLIPVVEFRPVKFLSVRGGYEYSYLYQTGNISVRHGAVGGITIKAWKFDFNGNFTYRQ